MKHRRRLENVLELYEDQVEHHRYMEHFITQERKNLSEEKKFEESLHAILGLSLRALVQEGGVPLDTSIDEILKSHQSSAQVFEEFIRLRKESKDPIFKSIALIYSRSIINQQDVERQVEAAKQYFQQSRVLQEDEINSHYQIRIYVDKIKFYTRVQKKILGEFKLYLSEIYNDMIDFARFELDRDNSPVIPKQFAHIDPQNFKLTLKDKAFYKRVVDKTYCFPESFASQELIVEESLSINIEEESNKKRINVKGVKRGALQKIQVLFLTRKKMNFLLLQKRTVKKLLFKIRMIYRQKKSNPCLLLLKRA